MEAPLAYPEWIESNRDAFRPPIGNKLMHKGGLSVMFVAGPNSRTDFHIDESSEFFFQLKGSMQLPIIERGMRKVVTIREGEIFLLPGRIPHSPQRESDSIGLVIERQRDIGREYDCLRWYKDFNTCEEIDFEKAFPCTDLGRDLKVVVSEYCRYKESGGFCFTRSQSPLILDDCDSVVPDPFSLKDWCGAHKAELLHGATLNLFGEDHPDREFEVSVTSESEKIIQALNEVFLIQIKGSACVSNTSESVVHDLDLDSCFVLPQGSCWTLKQTLVDSLTLILSYKLGKK